MLFNSLSFAVFLPIVFVLYWFVFHKQLKGQNILLLVVSYFFYACWDYRFLFLLMFSTFLDYSTGLAMFDAKTKSWKRFWFWLSIGVNLGFLGFFKYYNFFISSFADAIGLWGIHVDYWTLNIILPVGISFYTFHGLSYVIDIYYDRIQPERNFIDYSVFVSFFPLLVAGPIERATHLLPQIQRVRVFDYGNAVLGLRQILWGLFKKMVIADNCATLANLMFNDAAHQEGLKLVMGAVFFSLQIYGDFSGYSDIALGVARLFGFDLLRNFAFPYFSRDIAEFWRRWHISLSTWFRDYLYIPLGGSKGGMAKKVRNTFIIFLVSGFWHGANWTFIIWGLLNALYIMPSIVFETNRSNLNTVAQGKLFPTIREFFAVLITYCLTVFAWIFFRAESVTAAWIYVKNMVKGLLSKAAYVQALDFTLSTVGWALPLLILFFISIEWLGREQQFALQRLGERWKQPVRWVFYATLIFLIGMFMKTEETPFIYFQF
ncbi:MBOAT family O-acyltransferase [Flavobacterium stagni]|uniref:MBOAT family protein n=1 Tax=Flavobacterium stagni TaxID=2506421 RepID=A0A4Q1K881_9FLAO|nr:MBOAT family O-acyltransferase [Flavobacterium stagni]RXR21881.1 MBOAT family protein [Flavobacterium stagni]